MEDYIQKAAGHFLIKPLPDDWDKLNMGDQNQFICENIWEPFEEWEADAVYEEIENLAKSFQEVEEAAVNRVLGQMVRNLSKSDNNKQ